MLLRNKPELDEQVQRLQRQSDLGLITSNMFEEEIAKLTGADAKVIHDKFLHRFIRNDCLILYLESLRKEYKVGLVSNLGGGAMDAFFPPKDRLALFNDSVVSSEVGLEKPDPAIFLLACERLGVSASEAIMIDDIADNCRGARQAGLQAICYRNNEQLKGELSRYLRKDHP